MNVYIASSWRNLHQPAVVAAVRAAGHQVYDFRHPHPGNKGFAWSQIDSAWQAWTPQAYREALESPVARSSFDLDMNALRAYDACVLVLPCGRRQTIEHAALGGHPKEES